jgi:osmotically-inducible protein OsmY
MGAGAATVADLDLVVDWAARDKMRRDYPPVFKTDREIETALRETFRDDPRVAAFQTHASVEDGIATLSGVVNNLMAKKAAEEDARNTLGVWGVQNYLKVRPAQIPGDSELTARVKEALLRNAVTSLVPMAVRAIHGTVYLDGVIYSDYMRETASDVVYRVPGVVDLENNLLIGREPDVASIADWEIKANIRYRFNFSPRLDSSAIQVRVVDGIVTLEGVVDNELARRAAMDLARRAGARSIHDELTLKTGPPLSRSSDPAP